MWATGAFWRSLHVHLPCILGLLLLACRYLQQRGWDVTYLPVHKDGRVDVGQLSDAMRPDTAMISIMAVNNEIGVRQPLAEIGALCRQHKVFFHTDAAQVCFTRAAVTSLSVSCIGSLVLVPGRNVA